MTFNLHLTLKENKHISDVLRIIANECVMRHIKADQLIILVIQVSPKETNSIFIYKTFFLKKATLSLKLLKYLGPQQIFKSNLSQVFYKISALKYFATFIAKDLQ